MASDEEYVRKTMSGDNQAFNILINNYHGMIYGLAYRMLGNPDDAEDATQESFYEAFKSIRSFQFQSKFSTWLYRVAINTCQQQIRKARSQNRKIAAYTRDLEDRNRHVSDHTADEDLLRSERSEIIQKAISELPVKQRVVISLFYTQNLKYREIAEILDCSEGTVASRLNTAVRNLSSKLKKIFKDQL